MIIKYKNIKTFEEEELKRLFLSVKWESGNFPERLSIAMSNSGTVISAWDEDRLVGLASALDDKIMTVYMHYLLVDPEYQGYGVGEELIERIKARYKGYITFMLVTGINEIEFYEKHGFKIGEEEIPMFISKVEI